jgi:rod shape-determining protein MreC
VIVVIASIVLMTLDHRTDELEPVRSVLGLIVYPIQYVVSLPTQWGYWATDNLAERGTLIEQNQALRKKALLLEAKLQKLASLARENARLRRLLASAERFQEERVLVAELVAVDLDPYKQRLLINKGALEGVYTGQPMLDAHGVMGQVTHVNPISATAILISDPGHALPVQVDRNGLRTLAEGTGDPERLRVRYVPSNGDIRIGDVLVTSGLGGRFPSYYPVGEITGVERRPGEPFADVEARPFARLDRSREVLLVWWQPKLATEGSARPQPQGRLAAHP